MGNRLSLASQAFGSGSRNVAHGDLLDTDEEFSGTVI
jgi:hypothetical protein